MILAESTAHSELVEVNSRLDREACSPQDEPLVVRFEVVHIGAVAADFLADVGRGATGGTSDRRAV